MAEQGGARSTRGVRRPPPLQSVWRFQRTVGNREAQRILGIGDGRAEPNAAQESSEPPDKSWWRRLLARWREFPNKR
jgi:hypothetical protein